MEQENTNVETTEVEKGTAEPKETEVVDEKKYSDKDVDEIINKKFAKWKKEQEALNDEAKKLKSMNADEKAKYERDKKERELQEREQQIIKRELLAEAKAMLNERGLPIELAGVIDLTDAQSVKSSIDAVGKQWEDAVRKGVADRIKGNAPLQKATQGSNSVTKEQLQKMTYNERLQFKHSKPEEYNNLINS